MPIEKRTRVEFYLPERSDIAAYQSTLDWLAKELAYSRGGTTVTTPFSGLYRSGFHAELVADAVRILYCDFDVDVEDSEVERQLFQYLETTKSYLLSELEEEDIWIIYYATRRVM